MTCFRSTSYSELQFAIYLHEAQFHGWTWFMLNIKAFETAFRQASPRLLAIALAMCRNRHVAQDLVQEAGLIAWRKRDNFTEGTNFSAWSGQIVRNLALRHNRDAGRRQTIPLEESLSPGKSDATDKITTGDIEATNFALADQSFTRESIGDLLGIDDDLAAALNDLSEDARTCFLLRVLGQLTYDEIADTLDIAQGTAMSHVHRSRKRILSALSQKKDNPSIQDKGEERS